MAESQGDTETANQSGHDIGMLLKHYRRAITKTEAEEFYSITPDTMWGVGIILLFSFQHFEF